MHKNSNGQTLFDIGDTIKTLSKNIYRIEKEMTPGAQGATYKVVSEINKEVKVFKLLYDNESYSRIQKIFNDYKTKQLINELTFEFTIPQELFVGEGPQKGLSGYIMKNVGDCSIKDAIRDKSIFKMPQQKRFILLKNICAAFEQLHSIGYCYQDISPDNVRYDISTQKSYVIDVDNMDTNTAALRPNRKNAIKGTLWFIAPEVAFHKSFAASDADRYALATLLFFILIEACHPPYVGKIFYEELKFQVSGLDELYNMTNNDAYLTEKTAKNSLIFIFDDSNKCNTIEGIKFKYNTPAYQRTKDELTLIKKNWDKIPNDLQNLFLKAFRDPFTNYKERPKAADWKKVFEMSTFGAPIQVSMQPFVNSMQNSNEAYIVVNGKKTQPDFKAGFLLAGTEVGMPSLKSLLSIKQVGGDYVLTNESVFNIKMDGVMLSYKKTAKLKEGSKVELMQTQTFSLEFHIS